MVKMVMYCYDCIVRVLFVAGTARIHEYGLMLFMNVLAWYPRRPLSESSMCLV